MDCGASDRVNPSRQRAIDYHNQAVAIVQRDPQLAYRLLCSSVTVDPAFAAGWFMLGNSLADLKMLPGSISSFRRCLSCPEGEGPGELSRQLKAKALVNLGHRLVNNGQINEAEIASQAALDYLEENPDLEQCGRAFASTNMSLVLSIKGDTTASLEYAKEAYEMSQEPIIETGLAFAYLFAGDYANGLKHFEARIPYNLPQMMDYPWPRWDGDKVDTLFVAADQGIGDTLSFARFVRRAAARVEKLIFQVQPEILGMMTDAFKFTGYETTPTGIIEVVPQSHEIPQADAWCPIVSLPVSLGVTTEEIKWQSQEWVAHSPARPITPGWKSTIAKLHIGIAYGGSPQNEIDRWRSIPVEQFLELYRVPGVQLYSLQVGDRTKDLHAAGCAALIRDMSPWIKSASDTVSIMRDLDLIITIESFVGHLAGALGKECWVPLSLRGGDWRCGRSGDRPIWYPNTRLFRQGEDGEWGPVFERIVEGLNKKVSSC